MIDGIACPGDIPEVVLVPFLHGDVDAEAARLDGVDGILDNSGIPVSRFIESADEGFLVVGILFRIELLCMEEIVELAGLGLFHAARKFIFLHMFVAYEMYLLHLDLLSPLDVEIDAYGFLDDGVLLHFGFHLAVKETLLGIILLDDVGGCLLYIVRELAASAKVQPLLKVFLLAGLYAGERPFRHPGTLDDLDDQERGITVCAEMVDLHRHILEIALQPQTPDGSGQLIAGHGDIHPLLETGKRNNLILAEIIVALDTYAAHLVFGGTGIIHLHSPFLGERNGCTEQKRRQSNYPSELHSLFDFSITPVPRCKLFEGGQEAILSKIRPKCVGEHKFAVCGLPKQVVADSLLAGGADDEIRIREAGCHQIRLDAASSLGGHAVRSLLDIPLSAIAHEHYHRQPGIVGRGLFQVRNRLVERRREAGAVAKHHETHVILHHGLVFCGHRLEHQLHKCIHLLLGTPPVLFGECEKGEIRNPPFRAGFGDYTHAFYSLGVPEGPLLSAFLRPSAVAIHDDGNMFR